MARTKSRRSTRRKSETTSDDGSSPSSKVERAGRVAAPLPRAQTWAIVVVIVAAIIAFGGAIKGPFQFDDVASIPRNPTITRLWPPSVALNPPSRTAVSGRPTVNYSLAVNYAINDLLGVDQDAGAASSRAAVGYRIANILIHLLCGLLLFGVVRRTARLVRAPESWSLPSDRLAAIVTIIWLLHPLQTEAVDYVIQRTELLVSLFYLATLYASIRAWDAESGRARLGWYAVSIGACLLGMGSKEVMASAPLAVMLYDRAFRATAWRELLRSRGRLWFYVLLFATMAPLVVSILGGARADSVGFQHGVTWYEYLYSQAWAILHYIKLVFWPDQLTFDYGDTPVRGFGGVIGLVALTAFAVAIAMSWKRMVWVAFVGTWFFMLLAPSSSVVPIRTEIAAERRMYLALVPVLILLVVGAETMRRRISSLGVDRRRRALAVLALVVAAVYFMSSGWTGMIVASRIAGQGSVRTIIAILARLLIACIAAAATWWLVSVRDRRRVVAVIVAGLVLRSSMRSSVYSDPENLWRDAVAKVPTNPRAYDNLAAAIIQKDSSRFGEAERLLRTAIVIDSTYLAGWSNLADGELRQGRTTEGRALLEHALKINPDYVDATERLGGVLLKLGDNQQAISYLERATAVHPNDESLGSLAIAYLAVGRREDAKKALLRVVALNPRRADALGYLGAMFAEEGRPDEAVGYVEAAVRAGATTPESYALLSVTYAQLRRTEEAARAASLAAAQAGNDANVYVQLGRAMSIAQRPIDAEHYLARAVELDPRNPESITRLGLAKAANGQVSEAVALFRRALSVQPGYEPAQRALAGARAESRPP
jgi:protein O-mannosyl-transferase